MPVVASWIEKRPDRCGGDACIRNTRIPVWVLVNYRRLGSTDAEIIHSYPGITANDVEAAMEYAEQHSEEIDQTIRENERGDEGFVE